MKFEKKIGMSPGTAVYVGDRPALEMELSVIYYNPDSAQIEQLSGIDDVLKSENASKLSGSGVSWINITGLKDINSIKNLCELYGIHALTIEDILDTEQQPKIEMFDFYKFLSLKAIQQDINFLHKHEKKGKGLFNFRKIRDNEIDEFVIDQICILIMKNVLITFQEVPNNAFDNVKKRILSNIGRIRRMGVDYLGYAIIDAVVDEYFIVLHHLEEDIENLENQAIKTSDETFLADIQDTKKYLLKIKHAISPVKENILSITRHDEFFETGELKPFLQDLNENLNLALIMVENHREWLSNIMDVNISVLSYQMNKVMKVLATISTIFIPLTFIA